MSSFLSNMFGHHGKPSNAQQQQQQQQQQQHQHQQQVHPLSDALNHQQHQQHPQQHTHAHLGHQPLPVQPMHTSSTGSLAGSSVFANGFGPMPGAAAAAAAAAAGGQAQPQAQTQAQAQGQGQQLHLSHGNQRHLTPKLNPIEEDYSITDVTLGVGVHGKVRRCVHRVSMRSYALKVLDDRPRSRREIDLHWRCCGHPNIVDIIDVYENAVNGSKKLFLVMELMAGGELFEHIQKKTHFTEHEASLIMRKITSATRHIHSLNLAHRDLKPENLLFKDTTETSEIKLTDFGFAKEVDDAGLKTPCYTPYYVAPEILRAEAKSTATYDKSCDMWSLGVILYILLAGYPPFYSEGGQNISPGMKKRIRAGQYDFPAEEWGQVSPSVKQLIKQLLDTDPSKRITIEQMWRHPWISGSMEVPHTPLLTPKILQFETNLTDTKEEMSHALASLRVDNGIQIKPLPSAASALLARRQK